MTDNKLKGLDIPELKHKKVYTQEYVNKLEEKNNLLAQHIVELQKDKGRLIDELTKKADTNHSLVEQMAELESENAELKVKTGSSIDCEKAKKNGELCLGYGGDEDEPCEQCKNCIKCEGGYYQLGETDKDDHLAKAKEIIKELLDTQSQLDPYRDIFKDRILKAEQFLKEIEK